LLKSHDIVEGVPLWTMRSIAYVLTYATGEASLGDEGDACTKQELMIDLGRNR